MKSFSNSTFSLLLIAVILMNALLAFSKDPTSMNTAEPQSAQQSPNQDKRNSPAKVPIQWKRETFPEMNVKLDPRSPEMVNMPKELKDGKSENSPSQQKRHTQVKVPVQWKREAIPETNVKLDPRSPEMVNMPKELKDGQSENSPSQQRRHTRVKLTVPLKRGTKKIPETNLKRSPEMVKMPKEFNNGQSEHVQAGKRDPNSGRKKTPGHKPTL
ncbi:uncharacterized protein FA14DRAFT_184349 [Meira miltonrushii]|uniref:Uncharacterized protein n=1 Tax=Meira miltonrushii TaxID=1280837 RepID=A0A316VBT1_9BASI|nr:uncharacterized protein FA14DRAFT_184349 [Meira miltonrushii]PWN35022.1 hypothetical protein FA14DRAFT_184349 [Meira miltonrushii]